MERKVLVAVDHALFMAGPADSLKTPFSTSAPFFRIPVPLRLKMRNPYSRC